MSGGGVLYKTDVMMYTDCGCLLSLHSTRNLLSLRSRSDSISMHPVAAILLLCLYSYVAVHWLPFTIALIGAFVVGYAVRHTSHIHSTTDLITAASDILICFLHHLCCCCCFQALESVLTKTAPHMSTRRKLMVCPATNLQAIARWHSRKSTELNFSWLLFCLL